MPHTILKGSFFMPQLNNEIEKICKFAFHFSNMDTVFIDPMAQIKLELGHDQVPAPLEAYVGSLKYQLNLDDINSEFDILFHTSSYKINYISARVYDGLEYMGSIVLGPYLLEEPTALMIHEVLFENKFSHFT